MTYDLAVEDAMKIVCEAIGMDLAGNPSVKNTPERFARYLSEFNQKLDVEECLGKAYESPDTNMIIQSGIPFRMICEHHLLPALGKAAVGYVAQGKVVGLSKLTRLVQGVGTEKPSLQEHICERIATLLNEHVKAKGTMVVIEAEHGCMACRGVNRADVITTTSSVRGCFKDVAAARQEFLSLAKVRSL